MGDMLSDLKAHGFDQSSRTSSGLILIWCSKCRVWIQDQKAFHGLGCLNASKGQTYDWATPAEAAEPMTDTARKFLEFHQRNPQIYVELVRLARHAITLPGYGRRRIGIRMLWEIMRWNFTIEVDQAGDDYKLNDHLTSRYARMIDEKESDLKDIFELRELRS